MFCGYGEQKRVDGVRTGWVTVFGFIANRLLVKEEEEQVAFKF